MKIKKQLQAFSVSLFGPLCKYPKVATSNLKSLALNPKEINARTRGDRL